MSKFQAPTTPQKEQQSPQKRQKAVALKYNPDTDSSPQIVAKGVGVIAEKIIEKAEDIPIHQDAALIEDLTRLDLGNNIPPELYEVVAQVLIFISELDRQETARVNEIAQANEENVHWTKINSGGDGL